MNALPSSAQGKAEHLEGRALVSKSIKVNVYIQLLYGSNLIVLQYSLSPSDMEGGLVRITRDSGPPSGKSVKEVTYTNHHSMLK
jgi:hypothetical protein